MSILSQTNADSDNSGMTDLTGKIMLASMIFFFFVLVFILCLHFYAKWYWSQHQLPNTTQRRRRRRRRRLDFAAGHLEVTLGSSTTLSHGLDPSVLETIPVIAFDPKSFKDEELECAVCLCEVCDGEKARILPKCNHGFHVDCIDMWFQSHSTCPLCRNPVSNQKTIKSESTLQVQVQEADQGQNHQGVGDVEEPSSSSSVAEASGSSLEELVIDIPRPINEDEEDKSQLSMTRFKSLKRLLSGGGGNTRVNPSSPRNSDVEHGSIGQV